MNAERIPRVDKHSIRSERPCRRKRKEEEANQIGKRPRSERPLRKDRTQN